MSKTTTSRCIPLARPPQVPKRPISNTLVNTATTHGHPKAFVGSLFHVFCVKEAIQTGRVPSFEWGSEAVEDLKNMHGDFPIEFGDGWQEAWSRASGQLFRKTWADACNEIKDILQALKKIKLQKNREHAYHEALLEANLFSNEERGSASKSAAISLLASTLFQDDGCKNALLAVCGQLGSDTDTIGSMTGAILGSVCVEKPSSDLQDRDYITAEAIRISELPNYRERRMNTFAYDEKESSASASKIVWRGATPLLEGLGQV